MRTKLKKLRNNNGLSIRKTAEILGIDFVAYMRIEKGISNGSFETWKKIQKLFKIKDNDMWSLINVSRTVKDNIKQAKRN